MSFSLPDLPYAHDALAPYMSRETLEYHHDKHHLAYVNNGNKLLQGSPWEGQSLEQVVACDQGREDRRDEDPERREPAGARRRTDPRLRRVGALLLHRLPESAARLPQGIRRSSH